MPNTKAEFGIMVDYDNQILPLLSFGKLAFLVAIYSWVSGENARAVKNLKTLDESRQILNGQSRWNIGAPPLLRMHFFRKPPILPWQ